MAAVSKFYILSYIYEDSCKLVIMCSLARAFAARIYERERKKRKICFVSQMIVFDYDLSDNLNGPRYWRNGIYILC